MDFLPVQIFAPYAGLTLFIILWMTTRRSATKKLSFATQREEALRREKQEAVKDLASSKVREDGLSLQKVKLEAEMKELAELNRKYAPIISVEKEVQRLKTEVLNIEWRISTVRKTYAEKRSQLDQLEHQVAIYDDRIAFAELGVYEPHFDFTDSDQFKKEIISVRDRQKALISAGGGTICPKNWTLDGSQAKGQVMVNRQTRLTMRAFNNECEAAISNARWNNVVAMEKRILSAAAAINKENTSMGLSITDSYVKIKIEELRLTHEYREKQKAEKDERVELARAEREEKKLIAEAEAAEREEAKYQALLDKAKKDAETATGGVATAMGLRIAELEKALVEAHDASARARAMAEMTKSGYVYIISNVGSFGDDVVKIGLTRRLDPDDRVRELGDASVPFGFDVHAMIYSDEAPALEFALHREFAPRRINMMNYRKEFFRISLTDVEEAVKRLAPTASFFKDREAQEWHETLARRNQALQDMQTPASLFPAAI